MENRIVNGLQEIIDSINKKTPEEIAQMEAEVNLYQKIENERKRQMWYESQSGVNQRYWKESLDTYIPETDEEKRNLDYIKRFCNREIEKNMLLMIGNYGTGKTHLGAGIVRATGGHFVSSQKICLEYEMGSDYNAPKNKLEVLEYYSTVSDLVIDEVGRGGANESRILSYIINQRYENNEKLVLISNVEREELKNLLGKPIVDRLTEVCSTLSFNGRSRRG